jgi:hypothetical protein
LSGHEWPWIHFFIDYGLTRKTTAPIRPIGRIGPIGLIRPIKIFPFQKIDA